MTIDPPGTGVAVGIPVIVPIPGIPMPVRSINMAVVIDSPPEIEAKTPNPAETDGANRSPDPGQSPEPPARDDNAAVQLPPGPTAPAGPGRFRLLPGGDPRRAFRHRPTALPSRLSAGGRSRPADALRTVQLSVEELAAGIGRHGEVRPSPSGV